LELLDSILPVDFVPDTERIAEVSILASTRAANVNVKGLLVDVHNYRSHCVSLFLVSGGQRPNFHATDFLLIVSLGSRCFHFMGWGGFQIRLARRRAHPCDEQAVAIACSFSPFFHLKNA
jgi:hypothetical protein